MDRVSHIRFDPPGIDRAAWEWIVGNIPHGKPVLELGSGDTSTPALLQDYTVYSVENDPKRIGNHAGARYFLAVLKDGWYDTEIIKTIPKDYIFILVDGPWGTGNRSGFVKHLALFRNDVPIMFHDTDRVEERKLAYQVAYQLAALRCECNERFAVVFPK